MLCCNNLYIAYICYIVCSMSERSSRLRPVLLPSLMCLSPHAYMIENKNPLAAEQLMTTSLTNVFWNYPYLYPIMQELAGFDKETFKHSICVAECAARTYQSIAQEKGIPLNEIAHNTTVFLLGGFLHDVGKTSTRKYMEDSLRVLYPEQYRKGSSFLPLADAVVVAASQKDRRSSHQQREMQLHSAIGGDMIQRLCNDFPISKEISMQVVDFAYTHHQKPSDLLHLYSSYGQTPLRTTTHQEKLFHTILACADMAVAMREPRGYRSFTELSYNLIYHNICDQLSPKLLAAIGMRLEDRDAFAQHVVGSLWSIDEAVTQQHYNIEGMRVNGIEWRETPIENAQIIPSLNAQIWNDPTILRYINGFLDDVDKTPFVNAGRN